MTAQEQLIKRVGELKLNIGENLLELNRINKEMVAIELASMDFESRTAESKQRMQLEASNEEYHKLRMGYDDFKSEIEYETKIASYLENFVYGTFSKELYESVLLILERGD